MMVSRRKILSRSRDELHSNVFSRGGGKNSLHNGEMEEDDCWNTKEKLFQDHIAEVMSKWHSIDDEIWAKIIVLERNRRVAKAYARAPVLTVNGSDDGFDGFRIGVAGFDNPMRDAKTDDVIRNIGQGFKLKMDDVGNILIKRVSKASVRVKNTLTEESAVSNDILKLPGGMLDPEKPFKVFDMKKFQQNMSRELKRPYPDRRKLEAQCVSVVAFGNGVTADTDILDWPIWILCINIVAIEMLRSKLPPMAMAPPGRLRPRSMEPRSLMVNSSGRPILGVQGSSSDEDPYSVAGSGSSGSSGGNGMNGRSRSRDKPPKLPPREQHSAATAIYGPALWAKPGDGGKAAGGGMGGKNHGEVGRTKTGNEKKGGEDPYYSGLRARIPNFVRSRVSSAMNGAKGKVLAVSNVGGIRGKVGAADKEGHYSKGLTGRRSESAHALSHASAEGAGGQHLSLPPQIPSHPFWWHSRLYSDAMHAAAAASGHMSLGPSEQSSSSASNKGGHHYKRNPTNFVPYITDSSDSDYSHIYGKVRPTTNAGAVQGHYMTRKFPAKPMFMSHWE